MALDSLPPVLSDAADNGRSTRGTCGSCGNSNQFDFYEPKLVRVVIDHVVSDTRLARIGRAPEVLGPDWDIPMSPMVKTLAADKTLIVFGTKAGDALALDADKQGEPVWRIDVERRRVTGAGGGASSRTGGGGAGGGTDGAVGGAGGGTGAASSTTVYRGPIWGGALDGEYAYVGCGNGAVAALRLTDGQRKWCTPLNATPDNKVAYSAAVTVIPGVLFVAGSDGRLWALSTDDGHALWNFETARAFATVNSVPGRGGSIASTGPTVVGGMLFVGSGYGVVSETPGNVLLAFSVQ
jgi:polyvinyl alcohol dehydrogenase (cytochrome)